MAIARIAETQSKVAVLLRWIETPPTNVDQYELRIGLADAFGRLKVREAIPFLIRNINLQRWHHVNTWMKTAEVVQERMPAVAALILLGHDASKAIIRDYLSIPAADRLPAIFAVARIQDPDSRDFLATVRAQASLERYWADQGLKALDRQ
jgi:hypothetical protein